MEGREGCRVIGSIILLQKMLFQLRMKIQSYVDSFQSMFSFLRILGAKPTVTTCEVLSLAEQGLQGLYFECDEEVVSSAVELCISVYVAHEG